jgi:hemolysin D
MSLRHRAAAYRELLKRYWDVFAHYWGVRKTLGGGLFNQDEAEFLPAALAISEKPVSATAKYSGRILMAMVATTLLWSVIGHMDIVVNASGKIIPSQRTKTLASIDVASVRSLHVREGQKVKTGDLLVELDASAPDADHAKADDAAAQARLQAARSRALLAALAQQAPATPPELPSANSLSVPQDLWQAARLQLADQYRDFMAKQTRLDDEIERYSAALRLASERANDYEALAKNGDVSRHAWLEKEQMRVDVQGQLHDAKNQRAALVAQTRRDAQEALTEAQKIAVANTLDAHKAKQHSRLLKLLAPVDGTVQQLTVHTVGGVVPAAQPLMLIVPQENQVEVEAFLQNKDIGFVHPGQVAAVKIDAFEYTKYGTVPGRVTAVSRDAIEDEKQGLIYSVRVTLDRADIMVNGKAMALSAGMSANVEIKTGERRIIEYVLSPLLQHQREALNER